MKINDADVNFIFDSLSIEVKKVVSVNTYANFLVKVETNKETYYLKVFINKKESRVGCKLSKLYPLLSEKGVPVPTVLKYDDSLKIIQHPYLIISEIKGEELRDSIGGFDEEELRDFYYEFGKIVAEIHSITFDEFGETYDGKAVESFSEIGNKGPFDNWKEMHKEIINSRLSLLKGTGFKEIAEPIREWFEANSHLIDYKISPRLLHADLNQKNIFVKNKKISGVIDFDNAFVGHNEEELMRTELANFSDNKKLRDSFFRGYTEIISLDDGFEERRVFYYLSRSLVHIDCIIEYGENYVADVEKEQERIKREILGILKGESIKFDKN